MLPFDVVAKESYFECDGVRLPRYGSLTVSEAIALTQVLTKDLQALLFNPLLGPEASYHVRLLLAAVVLISRYDPTLTLDTLPALSVETVVAISEFLLEEQASAATPDNDDGDSIPIDWAELWWRLQRHYPHEPRFSAARFGNCPITLVKQALSSLQQERVEWLAQEAAALSLHAAYSLKVQGQKDADPNWFNPWQKAIERRIAKAEIPSDVAKTFLELTAEQKIPSWVLSIVDVEKLRYSAGD